jgi:hypothetical protein
MPSESEALRAETQQMLIAFLNTELQIGPTFAGSALLAKDAGHLDHYAQAKQNAVKAVETVRRFMGRVEDVTIRTEIRKQLAELDRLISTL